MAINGKTRQMLDMLPSWMKMRQDETSNGAKFLDVSGMQINIVDQDLNKYLKDLYIGSVDLFQVDIIYKAMSQVKLSTLDTLEIKGYTNSDGLVEYILYDAQILRHFYSASEDDHIFIADYAQDICYTRFPYDYITINGMMYTLEKHHVWGPLDELGLILGCPRIKGEANAEYHVRLLDAGQYPGGGNKDGLRSYISRNLNLYPQEVIIKPFNELAFADNMLNEDGTPSDKLLNYVSQINAVLPMTVGTAEWDKAYWDSIEESNLGFDYLPHVWDVSIASWSTNEFQSGYGDGDDVVVKAPVNESDIQMFDYYVGLKGTRINKTPVYPEHRCTVKLWAEGKVLSDEIIPEQYAYTIIASPRIPLIFNVRATKGWEESQHVDPNTAGISITGWTDYATNAARIESTNFIATDKTKAKIISAGAYRGLIAQYLEVNVDLGTKDQSKTPTLQDISITWTDNSDVQHTMTYTLRDAALAPSGNNFTAAFDTNNWTSSDAVKIKSDNFNVLMDPGTGSGVDASLKLAKGLYSKVIDTYGDWKNCELHRETNNIAINSGGYITLSN